MKAVSVFIVCLMAYFSAVSQESRSEVYKDKVKSLTEQIQQDPDNLLFYYERADAYDVLNDFGNANRDYGQVLNLYYENYKENKQYSGEFVKSCYMLADDYYYRKSSKDQALQLAQAGLKVDPNFRELQIIEGLILASDPNRLEEAIQKFEALSNLYPNDSKLNYKIAKALERNKPEAAIPFYEKTITQDSDNLDVLLTLGTHYTNHASYLYKSGGNTEEAYSSAKKGIGYFEKALELKPEDTEIIEILVLYYDFIGEDEKSTVLKKSLQ